MLRRPSCGPCADLGHPGADGMPTRGLHDKTVGTVLIRTMNHWHERWL